MNDRHKKIYTNHIINNLVKQTQQVYTLIMILIKLNNAQYGYLIIGFQGHITF